MGDAAGHCMEEDQVAGFHLVARDLMPLVELPLRGVGQRNALLPVEVTGEAGAVETAMPGSAVTIGRAAIRVGRADDVAFAVGRIGFRRIMPAMPGRGAVVRH